ncbi:MAG: hypothetical protein V4732_13710 [Pseudomonadota bacterium]
MNKFLTIFLLYSYVIAALIGALIILFNPQIYIVWVWQAFAILLLVSLIGVSTFLAYRFWVMNQIPKFLIISDQHVDQESLIEHYSNTQLSETFAPQVLSPALLTNDSPRVRLQLAQLKGSRFAPPRIIILVNADHFCNSNDGEQLVLSNNLNRLLYLLNHKNQSQQIDLFFTHTEKIPGFIHFSRWADHQQKTLRFSANKSLSLQLENYKNYSRALTQVAPDEFLAIVGFFNKLPGYLRPLDRLVDNLLLVSGTKTNRIFLSRHHP